MSIESDYYENNQKSYVTKGNVTIKKKHVVKPEATLYTNLSYDELLNLPTKEFIIALGYNSKAAKEILQLAKTIDRRYTIT